MMGTLAGCGGNKTTETENKTEGKTEETQQTAGTEEFSMADARDYSLSKDIHFFLRALKK